MGDYIDYRLIRKEAVSMLKSGSIIDKTMKNTMKMGSLQSVYDSSQSLIGNSSIDSLYSNIYQSPQMDLQPKNQNKGQITNKNFRSNNIDVNSLKDNLKEINPDIFEKLCFAAFKMFSKYPSDFPSDNEELIIELCNIEEAIQILSEYLETIPSKNINANLYFQNTKDLVTFDRFKEYASVVFNDIVMQSSRNNHRNNHIQSPHNKSPPNTTSQFRKVSNKNLLQSANQYLTQSAFAIPNLGPLPSIVSLQGKIVQTTYLKDSLTESFRYNDRIKQSSPKDDSTMGSPSNFSKSNISIPLNSDSNLLRPKISDKVSSLINPKEDEYNKWELMRNKRNQRIQRQEYMKLRQEMLCNFKKISIDADRNEFHQAYQNQFLYHTKQLKQNHEDNMKKEKKLKNNLLKNKHDNINKKQEEIKYMKYILKDALVQSKHIKNNEIMLSKMNVLDQQSINSIHDIDDSKNLSSIVDIPKDMKDRMKNAKSLIEYNKAKQDIKDYYENTMSNRIASYKKAKDMAMIRVDDELLENHIQKTPILGSLYFQESSSSIYIPHVSTTNTMNNTSMNSIYKFDDSYISNSSTTPIVNNVFSSDTSIRSNTSSRKDISISNNFHNNIIEDHHKTTMDIITMPPSVDISLRPSTREIAIAAYIETSQGYSEEFNDQQSLEFSLNSTNISLDCT